MATNTADLIWRATYGVAYPFIQAWVTNADRTWAQLPRPLDSPRASTRGGNPDRVLLIGNGATVGYGVLSHELALGGALARKLTALSGRATDVDIIADGDMTAASCREILAGVQLSRYDAIVMTVGLNHSLRLGSPQRWSRDVRRLFTHIAHNSPASLRAFAVAIPSVESIGTFPWIFRRAWNNHARVLNEMTRRACSQHSRISLVSFDPPPSTSPVGRQTRQTYDEWAALIANGMADHFRSLDEPRRPPSLQDEAARQAALDELGIVGTEPEEQYDRIVAMAQNLFGTAGAALSFMDHGRQWFKSTSGVPSAEAPRLLSFCNITIQGDGAFVVEDMTQDERFNEHPLVTGRAHLRFYAGYPVEGPNAQRVGALCILDRRPRSFTEREVALLRDLALQVQRALWAKNGNS